MAKKEKATKTANPKPEKAKKVNPEMAKINKITENLQLAETGRFSRISLGKLVVRTNYIQSCLLLDYLEENPKNYKNLVEMLKVHIAGYEY